MAGIPGGAGSPSSDRVGERVQLNTETGGHNPFTSSNESLTSIEAGGGGHDPAPQPPLAPTPRRDAPLPPITRNTMPPTPPARKIGTGGYFARLLRSWEFQASTSVQLLLLIALHTFASIAVFQHFFFKKWQVQRATLPVGAPHYWQKHTVPPFEFGAMHSLLFQMALLPLTMCRYFLTQLRTTRLNRYLPLDNMIAFHKYMGYMMSIQLIVLVGLFFLHFGTLCAAHKRGNEPVNFCKNFTDEIMITGYIIFGFILIMFFTSIGPVRRRIKYEVFYYVHHLFILLYVVTVIHTLDAKGRGKFEARSQTVKWLVATVCIYIADRTIRWRRTVWTKAASVALLTEPKAIVLKLRRPPSFEYRSGQYLQLNVPAISKMQWHPFAIGSSPRDEDHIDLYVRVVPGGWTESLYDLLKSSQAQGAPGGGVDFRIEGPYGSSLQDVFKHKHTVLVSTGSGVIPMLSLLRDIYASGKFILPGHRVSGGGAHVASPSPAESSDWAGSKSGLGRYRPVSNAGGLVLESLHVASMESMESMSPAASPARPPASLPAPATPASAPFQSPVGSAAGSTAGSVVVRNGSLVMPASVRMRSGGVGGVAAEIAPGALAGGARRDERGEVFMRMMETPVSAAGAWLESVASDAAFIAANSHPSYHLSMLLAACVDFLLLCCDLSWSTNTPNMEVTWPMVVRDNLTFVTISLFAVNIAAHHVKRLRHRRAQAWRRETSTGTCMLDAIAVVIMLVNLAGVYGEPIPGRSALAIAVLLRVYRVVWMLALNPLFLQKASGTTEASVQDHAFVRSIKFVWVASTFETFQWLHQPLQEAMEHVLRSTAEGYVDMTIYVARADKEAEGMIESLIAGTCLEGRVRFGKPDVGGKVNDICSELARRPGQQLGGGGVGAGYSLGSGGEPDSTVGVFYCGTSGLAEELRESIVHHPARIRGMPLIYGSESTIPA